ncbi:enoyl-CoA hydratase [Nocardia aurantia]|uniref:Probable enoyl-CoA hydratase echA8 n=1 Tax=Nocardia aurantia TaxID=2585199 RepID=A0A7K0E1R5_9NOCA|nr:enoyl-CoA hydratase [Nocardia aurantia]MQY31821.1 putative enoyl-CoA hydratase echA8 [Nocardia aurantia]
MTDEFDTILLERRDRVALLTLNRPEALNALNSQVLEDITTALDRLERDKTIGAVVLTGSSRAFAAGADIKEMQSKSYMDMFMTDHFAGWDRLTAFRKPLIVAVAGYALGGGCELAMMCDILIAADDAKFGQPEIKLGVIPGMGGSQRLSRAVGKAKAMDLILTGRTMDAQEAERSGLVARVVPADQLLPTALDVAATIAAMSLPAAMIAKEAVNRGYETALTEGLRFERRVFHSLFATDDQAEGMAAFVGKRAAKFTHR